MPSCAFQNCTSTWVPLAEYFKHSMLPHPQSVAKTGSTLPALQRECQLRSSAFPNQTDNLSLKCFSRKSKNYFFSRLVPSLLRHGGRWSLVCLQIPKPNCNLEWLLPLFHCSCHAGTCAAPKCPRWLPAVPFKIAQWLESFLSNISSTVCFPIPRALLRLVAHCLPCRESASWEAQPFLTKPTI